VTGAARGIGLETARLLHARGASVTLTDLDSDEVGAAAAGIGERTLALAGDATDRDSLDDAVAATVERFGALDVVVANAGVAPPLRTIASMAPDAFERVVEIDLLGVYRTVHVALPQVAMRGGHVVIVSSVYAFANGALASPYAVSKAAVEQLGRALRASSRPMAPGSRWSIPGSPTPRWSATRPPIPSPPGSRTWRPGS
jgi:NAD(P)-dependent dehydrogenase (short-subunit alcohol dehydrogenase family)